MALEYYDRKREKYKKFFSNDYEVKFQKSKLGKKVYFYNKKTKKKEIEGSYDELGYFYNNLKIWFWAWVHLYNDSKISKEILEYGLKIELKDLSKSNDIFYFIKNQLINSRSRITHNLDLEILLAISTYLVKDKFDFIYKEKYIIDKKKPEEYLYIYKFIKIDK